MEKNPIRADPLPAFLPQRESAKDTDAALIRESGVTVAKMVTTAYQSGLSRKTPAKKNSAENITVYLGRYPVNILEQKG